MSSSPSPPLARRWQLLLVCAMTACVSMITDGAPATSHVTDLHRDEEILFFPSLAHHLPRGGWECEVRGCVYEPEQRRVILGLLREALEFKRVEMNGQESAIFAERARLFLVDNQRGRKIVVRVGEREHTIGESRPDGHFSGRIRLSEAEVAIAGAKTLQIHAVLPSGDRRRPIGRIDLLEETGLSVVSDIDDTIKVTEVQDRSRLLRRTFLEPFVPVTGMAELYRAWADKSGAHFCYVSASPWQLFPPLSEFVSSNGFPAGVLYLKKFRWKDESFRSLFDSPEQYKPAVIEPLLKQFPRRQFVLVGDAGECDPEIYAALARRYPQQIVRILIRDVDGYMAQSNRYQTAFRDLPPDLWKVFHTPAGIPDFPRLRPGDEKKASSDARTAQPDARNCPDPAILHDIPDRHRTCVVCRAGAFPLGT